MTTKTVAKLATQSDTTETRGRKSRAPDQKPESPPARTSAMVSKRARQDRARQSWSPGLPAQTAVAPRSHAAPSNTRGMARRKAAVAAPDQIGPPDVAGSAGPPVRESKKARVLALLQQSGGASIAELTAATGWQVHTVRAFLTGVRKDGKELARTKDDGVTRYLIGG